MAPAARCASSLGARIGADLADAGPAGDELRLAFLGGKRIQPCVEEDAVVGARMQDGPGLLCGEREDRRHHAQQDLRHVVQRRLRRAARRGNRAWLYTGDP